MKKKEMDKRGGWIIFLMVLASSCSQALLSHQGVEPKEDVVWEDLRIQKLLPDFLILPAIEPCLPAHFVALRHPEDWSKVYWGEKEVLEDFFENGISHLKSAVISVDVSANVAQIDENSFSDEYSESDLAALGIKKSVCNKWKWGIHPVMSLDAMMDDREVNAAWIGLNEGGHVIVAGLIYPANQKAPSTEELNMWSDFLHKTKPLEEHEFFKSHGQDLREGFTLVNVNGSILKVSAEKRKGDGKIQVIIHAKDTQTSCKCLKVDQKLMGANWHFMEPVLKIQSEIQVDGAAFISSQQVITVLPAEVSEFSDDEMKKDSNSFTRSEHGDVAIFNFCAPALAKE